MIPTWRSPGWTRRSCSATGGSFTSERTLATTACARILVIWTSCSACIFPDRIDTELHAQLERPALTAVDDDRCTADPARSARCEECDHVAHLVRSAEAAERQFAFYVLGHPFRIVALAPPPGTPFERNRS